MLEQSIQAYAYEEQIALQKDRLQQRLSYLNTLTLEDIKLDMTEKEKALFETLLSKHKLYDQSFPGLFSVSTSHSFVIQTPPQLWQLWIYDTYIHGKTAPQDKIWVPQVKDIFYTMHKKGMFRLTCTFGDPHFPSAIQEYFERLGLLGMVRSLGRHTAKCQQILANQLPAHTGKELHSSVACYLSWKHEAFAEAVLTEELREAAAAYKEMMQGECLTRSTQEPE
ncbi:hypothetical protein [Ectobacillus ponti]|uniref:Uncharacterized protein n=1 Tax=Ectobacillus ponti TaxID=2961894 RepID=A0AA41XCQ5_9BACI|nr:hypothetical protein [Ectobacillus ponti]MCP8971030.1 hypothetical protein [Ectobacillus ponti]